MKAVVYKKYGQPEVLQLTEIEKPTLSDNEILVKVKATTVNRTDNATIKGIPFFVRIITGLFTPKKIIPGTEFAGDVEAVGQSVTRFKPGDRVFGFNDQGAMSHAEHLSINEKYTAIIPDNIDYLTAAASCEGAHYAYCIIRKTPLEKGQNVLVYGASGGIGSAAVQLLKHFEMHVTAVVSSRHVELLQSLGADKVVDYTVADFTQDELRYEFVLDAVGKASFRKCFSLLKPNGIYVSTDLGFMWQNLYLPMITPILRPLLKGKKSSFPMPDDIPGTLILIQKLLTENAFKPVIDREFNFNDIVSAFEYVGKGKKTGNVVITVR